MSGIKAYSAYIPFYRIKKSEISTQFGKGAKKGERAVAYWDEDSLTMAVAASMEAAKNSSKENIGAVYFASTTSPYMEKQCATQIAACLDLGLNVRTADYAASLRCAADAMLAANDFAATGKDAVAAVGDCRMGAADGSFEMDLGDGGAAFVFGSDKVIAEVKGSYSAAMDFHDMWRADDDKYVRFWDVRFGIVAHYEPMVKEAVSNLLKQAGLTSADITSFVSYAHEDRYRLSVAAQLGFTPEQIPAAMYNEIGNTGAAMAPQLLARVLDTAKPGDKIVYAGYGDGCTAILLEVTDEILHYCRESTVESKLLHKNSDITYGKYVKWKDSLQMEPQRRPDQERASLPDYFRNYRKNTAMYGSKCRRCGQPQFPAQRVCACCHTWDEMDPYCFLGVKASIRTFTLDGLALSKDSPNFLVVVGFDGGGKMMTYLVDCKREDIRVGMPVELSFRKIFKQNGVQTYFWKVVPATEKEGA